MRSSRGAEDGGARLDAPIRRLDLVPVRYVLAVARGWPLQRVLHAEQEYRWFLQLVRRDPARPQAPSLAADLFWHEHILCTQLYAEHCQQLFGTFLHHTPFAGSLGEADFRRQQQRYRSSRAALAKMRSARR